MPPPELQEKITELRTVAQAAGRDPKAITIGLGASVQFTDRAVAGQRPLFTGTPAQILESIHRYQEVGVQDFRVDFPSPSFEGLLQAMETFASKVRPQALV